MPAAVEERMAEYARMWRERGIRSWAEGWWTTPMTVGDQVGRIIGAPAGSTVMHQNVAVAEAIVLSCFRPVDRRRNRVVYEEGNFPSVRYLYQAQPDLEVVVVPDDGAIVEPLDVSALDVDFAVGGSVKWLCGGPGNGWLYVRPDLAEVLEPRFMGWQAHARPFGFEPELEYAEGAARFLTGTPNVPALYAATAGYDLIEEIVETRAYERHLGAAARF